MVREVLLTTRVSSECNFGQQLANYRQAGFYLTVLGHSSYWKIAVSQVVDSP